MAPRTVRLGPAHGVDAWLETVIDDPVRELARRFVVNLVVATDGLSLRDVADRTGVSRSALSSILRGAQWPDMETVARLEVGLGNELWPRVSVTWGADDGRA